MFQEGITEEEIELFHSMHEMIFHLVQVNEGINKKIDSLHRKVGQLEAITVSQKVQTERTIAEVSRVLKAIEGIRNFL